MASRVEILNEGGYRSDGRRQYELRSITIDMSSQGHADGSAAISHGLTHVIVSVFGPREAKQRANTIHNRANINVEITTAPFSTGDRRKRTRGDKAMLEFAALVKSTFEPVIQTHLYPRSQIDIYVQILQQDGGVLSAAINATTLAVINAGIPLYDYVCAISSGVHTTQALLDLTTLEENDVPHLTAAVMPKTGKVTLVTLETRLHIDLFEEIFTLACEAGKVIHKEMRAAVRKNTSGLVQAVHSANLPGENVQQDDNDDLNDMRVD